MKQTSPRITTRSTSPHTRGSRTWRSCAGLVLAALTACLTLALVFGPDAFAVMPYVTPAELPANWAPAPLAEIVEAVPFL